MTKVNEKEYIFEVTIKIDMNTYAENEADARANLTELVADYFAETTVEISDKEAKLIAVK
jgi:hypothetical protein